MTSPASRPARILLVDDHAIVRSGLRMLLEAESQLTVVAEASDTAAALRLAAREHPDLILLDLDLGGTSSLTILPEILTLAASAHVIVLTGSRDVEAHLQAVQLGARGVVLKEEAADVLVRAIEKVTQGEVWLDPSLTARLVGSSQRPSRAPEPDPEARKIALLTEREREVISLLAEGVQNKDLGRQLYISETTVRHHLTSIFNKLGVDNRLELVIYAFRNGLATPPR